MTPEELGFLKQFFQNLREQPLEPDDPRYVHIYRDRRLAPSDPVELLARAIEWTPGESVQLFSGFRGAGKAPSCGGCQPAGAAYDNLAAVLLGLCGCP